MLSKRFVNANGYLWYFDLAEPRQKVRQVTPKGAFWDWHLNTYEHLDGRKDDAAERIFSEVENSANDLLDKITAEVRAGRFPRLTSEARWLLDAFFQFQFKRTPDRFGGVVDDTTTRELIAFYEEKFGAKLLEEDAAALLSGVPTTKVHRNGTIAATTHLDPKVSETLANCGLFFGRPADDRLLTIGSNPILRWGPPFGQPEATLMLPIAPDLTLCLGDREKHGQLLTIPASEVRRMNLDIWDQSNSIAASSEALVLSLVRGRMRAAIAHQRNNAGT